MLKQHGNSDENAKVSMKESEEGWTKPMKYTPITHFYKKCDERK